MPVPVSFDRIAAQYDATHGYPPEVSGQIARGLMRLGAFGSGDDILEIGIGTGRIALPLLDRGVNVTGVDISAPMVERMREKLASLPPVDPVRHPRKAHRASCRYDGLTVGYGSIRRQYRSACLPSGARVGGRRSLRPFGCSDLAASS